MGNDIDSGPAMSIVYVRETDLDNNFTDKFCFIDFWTKKQQN